MTQLVLSLFPGIGLLDMAFEEEGFCVVRGPDLLWGGDIRRFHPLVGRFDGVIGGPPCQRFSRLRHMVVATGKQLAPDLIPEFARCVAEASPEWWLMENVPDAPGPETDGYVVTSRLVKDVAVGGDTTRVRRFTFGAIPAIGAFFVEGLALHRADPVQAVLATGSGRRRPVKIGGSGKIKGGGFPTRHVRGSGYLEMLAGQGLPADFLYDAPFTSDGRAQAVGNGVPLPMGRAVARAVKRALGGPPRS